MSETGKRVLVGEIATAHGVRGLVKVRAFGDDIGTLTEYGALFTGETGDKTVTLALKHQAGGAWIAEVKGVTDRNVAEGLRGTQLWLEREQLPDSDEGEYYHADLIGMKVVDEAGTEIGAVIAVENFGASDLLDIKPPTGESFYLPFVDEFVPEIDEENGVITVIIPPGLRDE